MIMPFQTLRLLGRSRYEYLNACILFIVCVIVVAYNFYVPYFVLLFVSCHRSHYTAVTRIISTCSNVPKARALRNFNYDILLQSMFSRVGHSVFGCWLVRLCAVDGWT